MSMFLRQLRAMVMIGLALSTAVAAATAMPVQQSEQGRHAGRLVNWDGNTVRIEGMDGNQHSFRMDRNVVLTLDGKPVKAEAIESGLRLQVMTQNTEPERAAKIAAINHQADYPSFFHDGSLIRVSNQQLVIQGADNNEMVHVISPATWWTLDGLQCPAGSLKPGNRVRVTLSDLTDGLVTRVEGLDKRSGFANLRYDGSVVEQRKAGGIVVRDGAGVDRVHLLMDHTIIVLDGASCAQTALKPGMRVRITTQNAWGELTDRIEAIDSAPAFAPERTDGSFVSLEGNCLMMSCGVGIMDQACTLMDGAKVSCDGTVRRAEELRAGMRIRITTSDADARKVIRIEAIDRNHGFAEEIHEGTFISHRNQRLVMASHPGKAETSWSTMPGIPVSCDGRPCTWADLKPGLKIRVTSSGASPPQATRLQALDQQTEFPAGR